MKITDFEIRNFRTFRHLSLNGLRGVNLIAGANNVGKTALLEALWQFSGPDQPDLGLRLNQFRGITLNTSDELLANLYHRYDTSQGITLTASGDWGTNRRSLRIENRVRETSRLALRGNGQGGEPKLPLQESSDEIVLRFNDGVEESGSTGWLAQQEVGPGLVQESFEKRVTKPLAVNRFPGHYFPPRHRNLPQEDAETYGRMELEGHEGLVLEALKFFEPNLVRLATISTKGVPTIHADVGLGRLIPTGLLGDGIQRVLSLVLAFKAASGGLILIDEVENGIHHSRLGYLWLAISKFSRWFDVQVFATTHSRECVMAAHQNFLETGSYDFCLLRLDRIGTQIVSKQLTEINLTTTFDANLEIR